MRKLRALVIDDDHTWQAILKELLTDAGLNVDIASSVEEALPVIKSNIHRVAVVDLSLAGTDHTNQDGLQILRFLRQSNPGCAAILLSGYATVDIAVSALTEYGAFTCLQKASFQRQIFLETIQRALASPPTVPGTPRINTKYSASAPAPALPLPMALVIDDDAGWRAILSEIVSDAKFRVRACISYGEVLGVMQREAISLAVVDLSLSGVEKSSAPEVVPEGRRLLASLNEMGVPAIVVSGVGIPEEIDLLYADLHIFAYLQKQTFSRQAFRQALEDLIASQAETNKPNLDPALATLTSREREVLALLGRGVTNKEISDTLFISPNTVKRHLKSIFKKLNIHTRSAAAAKASGLPE